MSDIERYLRVRAAANPVYSQKTGRWYFLMNLTDTFQLYGVDGPGHWPHMLTDYPERVSGVDASPHKAGLVFQRDRGANEHHQLYWMDLTTYEVAALTDNPSAVHVFGAFSPDGREIAYSSTARNGRDFDLYMLPLSDPGRAELIKTCEGQWTVVDWTDRDDWLLLEVRGNFEQIVHVMHGRSGALEQLTPSDQKAAYHHPILLQDGSVWALSDYGRDFAGLARIRSGSVEFVIEENADIEGLASDKDHNVLAYSVNRDGYSELHLYGPIDGSDRHIHDFDRSVIWGLNFTPDGETLAVTHSGPDHNMNVALVQVSDGSCERLTYAPMPGLNPQSLVFPELVRYPTFDGLKIPAYVYRPSGGGDCPVVVSVHGGPEAQERPYFLSLYQYLVSRGYAVVAPNVRGSTGYGKTFSHLDDRDKRMDSVRDLASLADWIRAEPGLDGSRVAIFGGSYGGFMVLSAITQYPDLFQAAVDVVGIANLETFLENTSAWRRALREVEYGYLATDREFLRCFSPIHYVDRIQTPLYVVHGANDPRVPLNEAEQIVAALNERGRTVELRVYPDEGHGIAKLKNRLDLYPDMVQFLDRHLK